LAIARKPRNISQTPIEPFQEYFVSTKIITMTQAGAFNAGAESWFVPEPEKSWWTRRIDWYFGFQLARSQAHKSKEFSPELYEIIQKWEVPVPRSLSRGTQSPLLISAQVLIPAQILVMVPLDNSSTDWMVKINILAEKLKCKSIRVFLPSDLPNENAIQEWPQDGTIEEISLVPDPIVQ
jgi:hypothetical protein